MDRQFFLKNLWLWKTGKVEMNMKRTNSKLEWSPLFEKLMRNRLQMGSYRYGCLNSSNKNKYDRIKAIIDKIDKYKQKNNKELLVDIANLCLLEFEEGEGFFESKHDVDHVDIIN